MDVTIQDAMDATVQDYIEEQVGLDEQVFEIIDQNVPSDDVESVFERNVIIDSDTESVPENNAVDEHKNAAVPEAQTDHPYFNRNTIAPVKHQKRRKPGKKRPRTQVDQTSASKDKHPHLTACI